MLIFTPVCSYFRHRACPNGDECTYLHKARFEVEIVAYKIGDDYFLGKDRPPKVCVFYSRGYCYNQHHCRFLHAGADNVSAITNERNICNMEAPMVTRYV